MIADLKPYPEYKDSGLPWVGHVPGHWELLAIRRVFRAVTRRDVQGDEVKMSMSRHLGLVPSAMLGTRSSAKSESISYSVCHVGDLVMNKYQAHAGLFGCAIRRGLITSNYTVFKPSPSANGAFFAKLFSSKPYQTAFEVESYGVGDGMAPLYTGVFYRIVTVLPPHDEQAAIVRFLDWANGRLERAIRAKGKVIALLNEEKQVIIHRAVTRGLDPSVPLKPSGIPWLGDIPQHWEVRKIRAVATRVTKGTTPTTLGKQFVDSGIRFVKVESISTDRSILDSRCAFIDEATDRLLSRSRLRAYDVVVSIAGAIGRPALVAPSLLPANTNQAVAIISPLTDLCRSEWLTYILASPMCLRAMTDESVQSAQANLSLANLGSTPIPLPPLHEQGSILASVSSKSANISTAISRLEREIDLLREYRTRLVADVVTGKLDVREAAARLPDEAPPDTGEDDADLSLDPEVADEAAAI